ncbi:hypothetical protein MN608_04527 [Microdochium nivale]|nr:hypothetical protein MN608_04527 [Microdochium nivale]
MCIIEFVAYTCGHRSVPVHRPCPMTTSLHTNPVCPPPPPLPPLPTKNHNSSSNGDPASILRATAIDTPAAATARATEVDGGCGEVGYAQRATYADGMCAPCARVLHANWVNIVELEHRWIHERGACGCPVVFPALMGPRVVGLNEGRGGHGNKNDGDERKEDLGRHRQRGRQQHSAEVQGGGDSRTSNVKGYSKSYRTTGEQNTMSAQGKKRVRVSKARSKNHRSDNTTSPSTNSVAPPLFEEHGPSWKNNSLQDYGAMAAAHGTHNGGDDDQRQQQPHLRVSIRLPSLYAAEWTQDHRLRHESGHCKCPVSFERYHGHGPDHEDFGGGERDENNNAEDCYTRSERDLTFYRSHCLNDEPEAQSANGDMEESEVKYLTTQSEEHVEPFNPFKLDRKNGDEALGKKAARRSSECQTRPRWRTACRRSPSTSRAGQHAPVYDKTAAHSPQPRAAADRWSSPKTDSDNISTRWPARDDYSEGSGVDDGTREMTFMERVMGPPARLMADASTWSIPVCFKSRSGIVSYKTSRRTNNEGLDTSTVATPQPSHGEEDFCEGAAHRESKYTQTRTSSTPSRLRSHNNRSHHLARPIGHYASPVRRYQESRHQRQGRRQQDHFRYEVDGYYQAESHDDDYNDDGNKAQLLRSPHRNVPIAGFPIGAGPEGHCHAGDFSTCSLSRRMGRRS